MFLNADLFDNLKAQCTEIEITRPIKADNVFLVQNSLPSYMYLHEIPRKQFFCGNGN